MSQNQTQSDKTTGKPADQAEMDRQAREHGATLDATEKLVDAELELTFPASDPPSYMGGSAVAGPPPHDRECREGVVTEPSDPHAVKPAVPRTTAEKAQTEIGDADLKEAENEEGNYE